MALCSSSSTLVRSSLNNNRWPLPELSRTPYQTPIPMTCTCGLTRSAEIKGSDKRQHRLEPPFPSLQGKLDRQTLPSRLYSRIHLCLNAERSFYTGFPIFQGYPPTLLTSIAKGFLYCLPILNPHSPGLQFASCIYTSRLYRLLSLIICLWSFGVILAVIPPSATFQLVNFIYYTSSEPFYRIVRLFLLV